ncbi:unnamed protein product [Sympodiomycopsis kandeliae]
MAGIPPTPKPYSHRPFPDVSGLRTSAPGRDGWLRVLRTLPPNIGIEAASQEQLNKWATGTIVAAAWAALLCHYIPEEETLDVAFLFKASVSIRINGPGIKSASVREFCDAISSQVKDTAEIEGLLDKTLLDASIQYSAGHQQDFDSKTDSVRLVVDDDDIEHIKLLAAARIHSVESAQLQIDQFSELLSSFIAELRTPSSSLTIPAVSVERFSIALRAGNNAQPAQIRCEDDAPLDSERFEGQFERWAKKTPNALALDFRSSIEDDAGRVALTYAELDHRANIVRAVLLEKTRELDADRVQDDDPIVALCLAKSPELYVAQLGILKAGAAWCPIDPDWPETRKQALLQKSGAAIVLTAGATICNTIMEILPDGMSHVSLDDINWKGRPIDQAVNRPGSRGPSTQLAYKIWTSGTTGLPKGVGIEHSAAVQALRALQKVIPHEGQIRYLQFSAYVFDLSILDCFYAWGLGGVICACPRELLLTNLAGVVNKFQATHTLLTPAVMAMTPREDCPSLEVVINGGEKLTQVVADMWSVNCCLLNLYGPAEATLIAMHRRVPQDDIMKAPNIGVALPTVSCHALNSEGQVVPKGAIGQLALGGFQCARGYMGDHQKTAEKFVQHPELGRIYMTGDLVRQLADESFEYLGREDDQIKINGIRIETLEISAIIRSSQTSVKDSETMALAIGDSNDVRIVNFSVLPKVGHTSSEQDPLRTDHEAAAVAKELRVSAQHALPSYMVPSLFLILSHFPRTSSSKIDRVALKKILADLDILAWENAIGSNESLSSGADAVPDSIMEQKIRRNLSSLCLIAEERIGRHTPLPSLGLDSIKAMLLVRRLADEKVKLSVIDIIQHPTLFELSQCAAAQNQDVLLERQESWQRFLASFQQYFKGPIANHYGIEEGLIEQILPTTPLQQGMLAETIRSKYCSAYWLNRVYSVEKGVETLRLHAAFEQELHGIPESRMLFCDVGQLSVDDVEATVFPCAFLQITRRDVKSVVRLCTTFDEEKLLHEAKLCTGSDPLAGRPALAVFVGQGVDSTKVLLRAHHSIYDARTLELLMENVANRVRDENHHSRLQRLSEALPYILPLSQEDSDEQLRCWTGALSQVPPQSSIAFPNLGGTVSTKESDHTYDHITTTFKDGWSSLARTAQGLGTSARPIAQCAWAAVLSAYLGAEWIVLGDSVSGRALGPELDRVMGPLHTTLAVPIRISGNVSRRQIVNDVDNFHKLTMKHQHVPLGFVRQQLGLSAEQSMFQSVFVFEANTENPGEQLLQKVHDLELSVEHPIAIEVIRNSKDVDDLQLGLIFQKGILHEQQARCLLLQFQASLQLFCDELDAPAQSWNSTRFDDALLSISQNEVADDIESAKSKSAESWLTHYAIERPNDCALEFWPSFDQDTIPQRVTYKSLYDKAAQLAGILSASSPRQSVIAVCLPRSIETYIAMIAIQLSANVYLPIDENLPQDRQRLLVQDSRAHQLLTSTAFASHFDGLDVMLCDVRASLAARTTTTSVHRPCTTYEDDLSYILYTSGSTGKPKGCKLTRANLSVAIEAFRLRFEQEAPESFTRGARFLARSADAFDVALLEAFLPLRTGSTIVTAPRQAILEDLHRAMSKSGVTHAAVVPSLFFSEGQRIKPDSLPALRALIVGGEQVSRDILDIWGVSRVVTLNAYGPTEATIGISMARIRKDISTSNVGAAFPGSQYVVMKEQHGQLRPTLRGEAGELCIVGPQVGSGYLGVSESPSFLSWRGRALYRTGDVARLTLNDEALYLGRLDGSQVKIRGARLELKEVDAVLASLGQVQAASVLLYVTEGQDPELVSFIAKEAMLPSRAEKSGKQLIIERSLKSVSSEIYEGARSRLPGHMLPSTIVPLQYLPLASISGKVDVSTLRKLYTSLAQDGLLSSVQADSSPQRALTKLECTIADHVQAIMSSSVRRPQVALGPTTNLFNAGLDSLTVILLVGRLKKSGLHTNVLEVMNDPTLQGIAGACKTAECAKEPDMGMQSQIDELTRNAAKALPQSLTIRQVLPCTPLQVALVTQTLASTSSSVPYVSRIDIDVDSGASKDGLIRAIDATVATHDIWRTSFAEIDDELRQIVHVASSSTFWVQDSGEQAILQEIISSMATCPPVRACWTGDQTARRQLSLVAHHALYDGISLDLFLREVELRYSNSMDAPKSKPFASAVFAINRVNRSNAEEFWQKTLNSATVAHFPNLHSERKENSSERRICERLSSVSARQLADAASKLGTTSQAVIVATFSSLYAQYVDEKDGVFGLVLSGRNSLIAEAETIHGPLITTVPFRTRQLLNHPESTHAQIAEVHKNLLEIYPYQHSSLLDIMRWAGVEGNVFNTLLSFLPQDASSQSSLFANIKTDMRTEYALAMEIQPSRDESLAVRIVCDVNLMPEQQTRLLLEQFDLELRRFIDDSPSRKLEQPLLASPAYAVSNPDPWQPAEHDHFLKMFEAQVFTRPEAIAIDFASNGLDSAFETYTYQKLDTISTRLARDIQSRHASSIVAVHMQRSPLFYAVLLAIWKAGKTYLPLDPSLPIDRLRYMLETTHTTFVVTDIQCQKTAQQLASNTLVAEEKSEISHSTTEFTNCEGHSLNSVAYLLFTSGSTGKPKGVSVTHRALAAALQSWKVILPYRPSSRMLQLASASFDVSLIEICMPLSLGFTIASAPKEVLLEDMEETFRKLRLTMADLPSSLATVVHPENVPVLEWLMSGGDVMDERVLSEWAPHGLINAWGPTEATIGNTLGFVTAKTKKSLVGGAYPGSSIYVLKPNSCELMYKGCVGELAVGGPQVAEGYFGRPDLTKIAFFRLPDGTPVYRTGDRGRLLSNGDVEVLGRICRGQVKLRGQRLELDEISQLFHSNKQVVDADTLYVQHPKLPSKQLVTWLSIKDGGRRRSVTIKMRTDAEAMQVLQETSSLIQKKLPTYMIPAHILIADGPLPLTPNNKIDHAALEEAFKGLDIASLRSMDDSLRSRERDMEWTETELLVRRTVADFCKISAESIQRTTSFYRLGIDSISALGLVRQLREAGVGPLAVRDLLQWSNVALLAEHLACKTSADAKTQALKAPESASLLGKIESHDWKLGADDVLESLLPCTPLQSGMLDQTVASSGRLYVHHHPFFVKGATVESLKRTWKAVVSSNDILRTSFHQETGGGKWVQAVHRDPALDIVVKPDACSNDASKLFAVQDKISGGIELHSIPLRLTIAEHERSLMVVVSMHHALYDGNTISLLCADLEAMLARRPVSSRPHFSSLAPLLLPTETATKHWAAQLRNYEYVGGTVDMENASTCAHSVKVDLAIDQIKRHAQELEVSLRTVAVFAYARALASVHQVRDVVLGQIFALRDVGHGAELALGPLFNTVPTRITMPVGESIASVLKRVQKESDEGRPHRMASLQSIQTKLQLLTSPFDAIFDYHLEAGQQASKYVTAVEVAADPVIQFPINVEFKQTAAGMSISATASEAMFTGSELQRFLHTIRSIFISSLLDSTKAVDEVAAHAPLPLTAAIEPTGQPSIDATEADRKVFISLIVELFSINEAQIANETSLASLGIDSISVLRLASAARQRGLSLTVADIALGKTVAGTLKRSAARLANQHKEKSSQIPMPITDIHVRQAVLAKLALQDSSVEAILPTLPGQTFQLARWLNSGKRTGMYCHTLKFDGLLDRQRLQHAWTELRNVHNIMRTTFVSVQQSPYQVLLRNDAIGSDASVHFTEIDAEQDLLAAGKQKLTSLFAQGSTLQRPPSAMHAIVSQDGALVILHLSHAMYDAWSIEAILNDLIKLYNGETLPTSPLFVFANFAEMFDSTEGEEEEHNFWRQELKGASFTLLPFSHAKTSRAVLVYEPSAFALASEYSALQQQLPADVAPPLQYLFMAAWTMELASLTRSKRPTFGLYHSGRTVDVGELQDAKGPLLNVLPMAAPSTCSQEAHLAELALAFQEATARRLPHEQTHLAKICRELGREDSPLFDTCLNLIWNVKSHHNGDADINGASDPAPGSTSACNGLHVHSKWSQVKLGNPTDFMPSEAIGGKTMIDELSASLTDTVKVALEVDVVLQPGLKEVGIGINSAAAKLFGEAEMREMIGRIAGRVTEEVRRLQACTA